MSYDLPRRELLEQQADWLASARSRILRKAQIGIRKRILDLGCGYGSVLPDLERRSAGSVFAIDHAREALTVIQPRYHRVCGDIHSLPFPDRSFDLIFTQNVMLWVREPAKVCAEVFRTVSQNGVWALFEPDFGGLMEYPPKIETRQLWLDALHRAGADPCIGRKLPALLEAARFEVEVELLPELHPPDPLRFDFLAELPLTSEERKRLDEIRENDASISGRQTAHLPYYLITARK